MHKAPIIRIEQTREDLTIDLPGDPPSRKSHVIVWRSDPLTGKKSVISDGLINKSSILFGETDFELLRALSESSRPGCIFCRGRVESVTPMYPREWLPEGRMTGHHSILFPNLFPLSKIHAVLTWPDHHILNLNEIGSEILSDLFRLSLRFIRVVSSGDRSLKFISLNANHLPPAGASVMHPHFQILGSENIPPGVHELRSAALQFQRRHRKNYWKMLIDQERNTGHRWIGQTGCWHWIAAFSPAGPNEIYGIHPECSCVEQLEPDDMDSLAKGLSGILSGFHDLGCSTYNFSLTGGDPRHSMGQRCTARIITRQNFRANYRADGYFLQRLLGMELIVIPPENLALILRSKF